ncbi:MAG: DEAD/DEAH box helicase [Chromatiaceae bacterium]
MSTAFSHFLLPDELHRSLVQEGYETPTQVQEQVIPLAMEGLDLLVSAATGSGKTAAFLLPMMQRFVDNRLHASGTRALILVPTRELARQIYIQFLRLGSFTRLSAGVITGGEAKSHQIATLRKNPEILVATPGRLLEHLEGDEVDLADLEILVLDEADRMLDMGFADDVLTIIGRCNPARQSMLFSATLHHKGLAGITGPLLRDPRTLVVNPVREQHPDIEHQILLSDAPEHKERQLLWLLGHETVEKALIFTNTRERTVSLGAFLVGKGQRVVVLHGEMEQRERNRVMGLFLRGEVPVMIATDLAARGLDVPGIGLVINFDPPRSGDEYLHRTGRTGRAGERGVAITLVNSQEWNRVEGIGRYLRIEFVPRTIKGMESRFQGPVKRKGPNKAAQAAKAKSQAAAKKAAARPKDRLRDRKAIGKRRKPASVGASEAGMGPPKKAKPRTPAGGS